MYIVNAVDHMHGQQGTFGILPVYSVEEFLPLSVCAAIDPSKHAPITSENRVHSANFAGMQD
jgi:hypothetical protein